MLEFVATKIQVVLRKLSELRARHKLQCNTALWNALQDYLKATKSTGCGVSDYCALYYEIRKKKPIEVLECGTGVSTLVIAHALKENERETGCRGRVAR